MDHHWVDIHCKPAQPPSLFPSSLNLQKMFLIHKKNKPKKSEKQKGQSDEDFFGNTDYISGDLPAAAKMKGWMKWKQQQQQAQREQLKRVSLCPYGRLLTSFNKVIIAWCER